jgi:hypothetical protein
VWGATDGALAFPTRHATHVTAGISTAVVVQSISTPPWERVWCNEKMTLSQGDRPRSQKESPAGTGTQTQRGYPTAWDPRPGRFTGCRAWQSAAASVGEFIDENGGGPGVRLRKAADR